MLKVSNVSFRQKNHLEKYICVQNHMKFVNQVGKRNHVCDHVIMFLDTGDVERDLGGMHVTVSRTKCGGS